MSTVLITKNMQSGQDWLSYSLLQGEYQVIDVGSIIYLTQPIKREQCIHAVQSTVH